LDASPSPKDTVFNFSKKFGNLLLQAGQKTQKFAKRRFLGDQTGGGSKGGDLSRSQTFDHSPKETKTQKMLEALDRMLAAQKHFENLKKKSGNEFMDKLSTTVAASVPLDCSFHFTYLSDFFFSSRQESVPGSMNLRGRVVTPLFRTSKLVCASAFGVLRWPPTVFCLSVREKRDK